MTDGSDSDQECVDAIIDSNVMLEIATCLDMSRAYNKPGMDPESDELTLRRQKARESLILSFHLHDMRATTFSLFEPVRITLREIDPEEPDTFEYHATAIWANYVRDHIIVNWRMLGPGAIEGEPTGNRADALLVDRARHYGVPLVSHEGVGVAGVDPKSGIRVKARAAGVTVLTPKDFYGELDELLVCARFMQRYLAGMDAWAASCTHPAGMRDSMLWLEGYYRHVLYGVTEGRGDPLPVRLSPRT